MDNTRGKHLETLLVILVGMVGLYLYSDRVEFLYVGGGLAVVGLVSGWAAKWIHWGWMGLAKVLGFVNSHVILTVVFFGFLLPLALLRRLGRKDPMQLRQRPEGSYFAEGKGAWQAKDLEKPW